MIAKPTGKRAENSLRQRNAILAAAVAVFSRKGFAKAEVGEIARRARVGKGTIYLYFEDKSDLFAAAVAEGIESLIAQLQAELVSDLPFLQHLRRLVEKNVSLYLEYGNLTRIFNNELSLSLEPRSRNRIQQARDRGLKFFSELLADGYRRGYLRQVDFDLAAVGIVGLLDSLCSYQLRNHDRLGKQEIINTIFDLLATGLLDRERRPGRAGIFAKFKEGNHGQWRKVHG